MDQRVYMKSTWGSKDISYVQVLPMLQPTIVTCQGWQEGCRLIANHPCIKPRSFVVKCHVLHCPNLSGLAPSLQFCPPMRAGMLQIRPRHIELVNPFVFRLHLSGAREHEEPFFLQIVGRQMPGTATFSFHVLGQLQPTCNVAGSSPTKRVRNEGGHGAVIFQKTP